MAYFPFMIELKDRICLIVGGGAVACRKAKTMLDFGAHVTVVAPEICEELEKLTPIRIVRRKARVSDVHDAFVVIMATNDAAANHELADECRRLGILVNVVDVKDECGFCFPAIIKDGEVVVSVSTGGQSPTLAGRIKRELENAMSQDYGQMAEKLGSVRRQVRENIKDENDRKKFYSEMVAGMCDGQFAGLNIAQHIRVGTRGSRLALVQAELVRSAIAKAFPGVETEIVILTTKGDTDKTRPLTEFGGKAVFVEELEDALLSGRIDIAVHSAKDMPMEFTDGLSVPGVLPRANPCDILIYREGYDIETAESFVVGTSSLRRQYQISDIYGNALCRPLRGNVDTRIRKLKLGEYDAVILAAAGIERLGLQAEDGLVYKYLSTSDMVPAACQGIIAMETVSDGLAYRMAQAVNDETSYIQFQCERAVLRGMNAGCHEPIGVYSELVGGEIALTLMQAEETGDAPRITRRTVTAPDDAWESVVHAMLNR